ncbi:hypothetical protein FEM48_Zijuj04G0011800 [Ziziphus jujuba var. spinosa]|uniref:Sister chromatid cohesion 1 protein 2 n=1 Tax=Ziziphus jujuba var. spinosa TaxID=714518 RepID=A0A978VGZ3_ZIZJJ|nr:hypothetical protein FEM48_Zijuj04G0011800 [Ziziphus jujuba var. spinosa]
MFHSQCLLSGKGPLGAIWVAAYFSKKLKKAQVTQTDISSSIDKILQDALHFVTYRVLGYLLLGVVRIYSKKVEYLFDDCHKVLIRINDFVVGTKENANTETLRAPYFSITLPERFELDAFDLEILEDTSIGNVVPREEITLKDGTSENLAVGQYALDMYCCDKIATSQSTCSASYNLVEEILSSCLMNINMDLGTSHNLNRSKTSMEKLQEIRFSEEECMDLEMFYGIEEPHNPVNPNAEDKTDKEKIKDPKISASEDGMHGEASIEKFRDSSFNQERFGGEPPYHIEPYSQDPKIGQEQMKVSEFAPLGNEMYQIVRGDHNSNNSLAEVEKLQDYTHASEECMGHAMFSGTEEPQELVRLGPFDEENHDDGEQMFLEMANRECQTIMEDRPLSIALDGTPKSKVPDSLDATTPQFMVIPTPTTKERARVSRKRKCVIDDIIVLPNEVVRKSIHDASDLVSKRRKVPHTPLAAWKACGNRNISRCFLGPLVPLVVSLEIRSLFCEKKLKVIESAQTVGPPEKLDIPESLNVGGSEQISIAPETPVQHSTSMRTFKSPGSPEALEFDGERHAAFEIVEKEQSLCRDPQFDLNLYEEIDSCLEDNPEMHGCSGRTRIVARYLHRSFLNQKKQREKEVVNLLPTVEGRNKKESARLFYEILVLKTEGYVDVKQDDSYGDILVWKLPRWDQICGDDDQ